MAQVVTLLLGPSENSLLKAKKVAKPIEDSIKSRKISHEYLEILGETTNNLIFCLLDQNKNRRFTREQIRISIEEHVSQQKANGKKNSDLARIQTGKAAINYWIDIFVENKVFKKLQSKPVQFWRD
jgi:hypothetical protein